MKGGFIADASLGAAWAVETQSTRPTEQLLDEVRSGRPFIVPGLWMIEMANTLVMLRRRKRLSPDQQEQARIFLHKLAPIVDDEGPKQAFGRILDLAQEYAMSAYDAVYLELSLRRKVPLASRDADLNHAARRRGVEVLL